METTATKVETGLFLWHELLTGDRDAAINFYKHVIGWNTQKYDFQGNEGPAYTMWMAGEAPVGGVMYRMFGLGEKMYGGIYNKPPDMPAPPHWLFYIKVDEIDAALEQVKERGGKVLSGPMEVPGGDRVAQCLDPEGVGFGRHEAKK